MKRHLKILVLAVFCLTDVCVSGQPENRITERILYTVRFDNKDRQEGGFYNHLDSVAQANLINLICDLVYGKKLKASYYWGDEVGSLPFYSPLGEQLTEDYFKRNDTIRYRYNSPPYETNSFGGVSRDDFVYRYLINSLSFYERWYFDMKTNIFTKKVSNVILFKDKYTHNVGMNCNYSVYLNDTSANEYNPGFLIAKDIIYDVPVTKGDTILNEYNWWHNYLEASRRERFFDILTYKALDDSILPFKTFNGKYPYDTLLEKTKYINVGLGELFYGRSNWYASDPLMSGMTAAKIKAQSYELADWTTIKKIRFHESWYFDPDKLRFEKKVLGIGMVVDTFDDSGKKTGEKCLVYYKLNY